jgi:hypothetical protein
MATKFQVIIDSTYDKLKEYDFINMLKEDADEILKSYIRPACVSYFYRGNRTLERNDKLEEFIEDLDDISIEVLANYICISYLDANYIKTTLALKAHLSGTDFHNYASKDVLAKAIEVRELFKKENDQLTINYSYGKDCPLWNLKRGSRK